MITTDHASVLPVQSVILTLTRSCNLRCSYCYQNHDSAAKLSHTRLLDALQKLLAGSDRVRVTFSGGEPLLEFGMIEQIVRAGRSGALGPSTIDWSLMTNGLLLDERRLAWLREHGFSLQISLQADPQQPAARRASLLALHRIREGAGFQASDTVTLTVFPGCASTLAETVELAVTSGAPEVALVPDMRPGLDAIESEDDWFSSLAPLASKFRPESGPHPVGNFNLSLFPPDLPRLCGLTNPASLTLDADGRAWSCPALIDCGHPSNSMDDAQSMAQEALLGFPLHSEFEVRRRSLRERISAHPALTSSPSHESCQDCFAAPTCSMCPGTKLRMLRAELSDPGAFFCSFQRAIARIQYSLIDRWTRLP